MNLSELVRQAAWDYFVKVITDPNLDVAKVQEDVRKINEIIRKANELWP